MIGKRVGLEQALDGLSDGMSVAVSGLGLSSNPEALNDAVLDRDVRELTLVSNNAGAMGLGLARWLQEGRVARVISTDIGSNHDLQRVRDDGSVQQFTSVRRSVDAPTRCCWHSVLRTQAQSVLASGRYWFLSVPCRLADPGGSR